MIEPAAGAAWTVQGEAVSIGPAVEADSVIWTARLKTGRVVTFRASGSRDFRAGALIASVAVEADSVVIDSVAAVMGADLAAVALAGWRFGGADFAAVAAGSEAGDEINAWNVLSYFL